MSQLGWNMPSEAEFISTILDYVRLRYPSVDTCVAISDGEPVLLLKSKVDDIGIQETMIRIDMQTR